MVKLYRVKDIADMIGVPKQQVYRYITDKGFTPVDRMIVRGKAAYLYDEETVRKVKEYFRIKNTKDLTNDADCDTVIHEDEAVGKAYDVLHNKKSASDSEALYTVLLKQIESLERQLKEKDTQIRELLILSNNLAKK